MQGCKRDCDSLGLLLFVTTSTEGHVRRAPVSMSDSAGALPSRGCGPEGDLVVTAAPGQRETAANEGPVF